MNVNQIVLLFLPLLLVCIFLRPSIALYYLVLDSMLILRISDVTIIHPAVTINRLIVFFTLALQLFRCGQSTRRLMRLPFSTSVSIFVSLFLVYCIFSFYSYTGEIHAGLLNNFIFYFLTLLLLEDDFEKQFSAISIVMLIPLVLLSISTITNNIIIGDVGQKSYAGNRIQTAFYVLLCIPFAFAHNKKLKDKLLLIKGTSSLIITGYVSVFLSLGRLVTFIGIVSILYYKIKHYITFRTLLVVFMCISCVAIFEISMIGSFLEKLVRLPHKSIHEVSKYSEDDKAAFTSGRSEAYAYAWRMYKKQPLTGIGYDGWVQRQRSNKPASLHSRWLQILIETGPQGFMLYAALYIAGFSILLKKKYSDTISPNSELIRDALTANLLAFVLIGITDNHGFTDRAFYLLLAMIATFQSQQQCIHLARSKSPVRRVL